MPSENYYVDREGEGEHITVNRLLFFCDLKSLRLCFCFSLREVYGMYVRIGWWGEYAEAMEYTLVLKVSSWTVYPTYISYIQRIILVTSMNEYDELPPTWSCTSYMSRRNVNAACQL